MSIPTTFCIFMPQRKERAQQEFARLNIPVHMFPAFQGTKMGIQTSVPYLRDHASDYWGPPYGTGTNPPFFVGPGINALALTNFAIIRMALSLGYDEIMIAEDDVSFIPNFTQELEEVRTELPKDYLMCHLGWCCEHFKNPYSTRLKLGKVLCTQLMMYSKAGMQLISDNAVTGVPYDIFLFDIMPPQFIADPQLASQLSISGQLPTTLS
jgi:hypothetical protein